MIFFILPLLVGCSSAGARPALIGSPDSSPAFPVYIVSNNFHTGIILDLEGPAGRELAFARRFRGRRYVDIGWGDEVIYQAPGIEACSAIRAMLVPSSSVVRAEAFDGDMANAAAWSGRAVVLRLSGEQLVRLCGFINGSLARDESGNPVMASSRGRDTAFFKSGLRYHLFRTCNTWVARGLNHAGLDILPFCVITAGTLFRRLEAHGARLK